MALGPVQPTTVTRKTNRVLAKDPVAMGKALDRIYGAVQQRGTSTRQKLKRLPSYHPGDDIKRGA